MDHNLLCIGLERVRKGKVQFVQEQILYLLLLVRSNMHQYEVSIGRQTKRLATDKNFHWMMVKCRNITYVYLCLGKGNQGNKKTCACFFAASEYSCRHLQVSMPKRLCLDGGEIHIIRSSGSGPCSQFKSTGLEACMNCAYDDVSMWSGFRGRQLSERLQMVPQGTAPLT